MRKNETSFMALACLFVSCLVVANILASKVLQIGPLEVPAAILAYPLTFLVTDLIGEIWGKKHAQKVVLIGIFCQILTLIMIYAAIYLPSTDYMTEYSKEFEDVLSSSARVVLASLVSFMISQTLDVHVFHKLKSNHPGKKWLRNNASTFCSQTVDSISFIFIAFYGLGYDIPLMIASQILIKWIIALCDTPVFYLLTNKLSEEE